MIDIDQLRSLVIDPALKAINLYSPEASDLVLGTGIQESRLTYIAQLGKGPAKGLWQMERATHDDLWNNFLRFKPVLKGQVLALSVHGTAEEMVYNLLYAAAMCRVHYYRAPERIPATLEGQAALWKKRYNTPLGAGTAQQYIDHWTKAVPKVVTPAPQAPIPVALTTDS